MMKILWVVALSASAFGQSYWTPVTKAETIEYAGAIAVDSFVSQQPGFVEQDPIAKPFVRNGWKGQAFGSALGFAAGVGPSYLLYRTGHKKLSQAWLHLFASAESLNAADMLYKWEVR